MNSRIGPREAALREMREAKAKRKPNPLEDAARGRDPQPDPVAKATKGRTGTAVVTGHVRQSTTGTGLRVGEAGADQSKRGRGRPKATGPREWETQGISRAEWYRRKAEAEKAKPDGQ